MTQKVSKIYLAVIFLMSFICVFAQEKNYYQTDFSKEDFAERRAKIFEKIGKNSIAIVQGAKGTGDFKDQKSVV